MPGSVFWRVQVFSKSVHKMYHTTKHFVLIKVQNDILYAIDNIQSVILLLLISQLPLIPYTTVFGNVVTWFQYPTSRRASSMLKDASTYFVAVTVVCLKVPF